MAYPKAIPNYDLYGDQASPAWSNSFNFEWIPQRSGPYQWVIHPHRHDGFVQLLYLTRGHVQVQIDDTTAQAQAPCLLLVPAGHVHGFRFSPDIDGPVVTATQKTLEALATAAMPELLPMLRKPLILPLHDKDDALHHQAIMPLFLALEQESRHHAPGQLAAGMSLLLTLLIHIYRMAGMATRDQNQPHLLAPSRRSRQIEKFRATVDRDFRQQHSVQAYASVIGVTPGQLSRLCRESLGMSALDVINARILHEAQRLLVYTALPVKQVAAELGFDDDAYFSRFFRKHAGVTPKTFRQNALEGLQGT